MTVDDSPYLVRRIHLLMNDIEGVDFLGNASTLPDALRLMDDLKPDVAIVDIQLDKKNPDENGISLLKTAKEMFPELTIIMLTNFSMAPYRKRCLQLGADFFFDKSVDFEKIPSVLKKLITTN
ncbi:MAG TPA: response regulator transcription factor [Cyclobacteriaceae bacterium]|nr:response regulator transcription factor [Cyclobacteriaceae bacterium]HRJ82990.1 response regulator transcription factor [Cyclobacteriaceae bacterium]